MTETGCDPAAYINSIKKPIDPNRSQPFPDRVVEIHKSGGARTSLERSAHSTYYPLKKKK